MWNNPINEKNILELNLSKTEFIERLKAVTIPISIDKINQINKKDIGIWFKNFIKQDYAALNKQFALEQDIFAETQMPENYVFAGEVNENEIKIFIPNPEKDKSFKIQHIEKIADDELKVLLREEKKIEQESRKYLDSNYQGLTIDRNRLFYYEIQIESLCEKIRLAITKCKFKYMLDEKDEIINNPVSRGRTIKGDIGIAFYAALLLALVYFVEPFVIHSHALFELLILPGLAIAIIGTFTSRLETSIDYIQAQRNISDEVFTLVLERIMQ